MTTGSSAHLCLISVAIEPTNEADRSRLAESLSTLAADDPALRVDRDRDTGRTSISGAGEAHIENVVQRLVEVVTPEVFITVPPDPDGDEPVIVAMRVA